MYPRYFIWIEKKTFSTRNVKQVRFQSRILDEDEIKDDQSAEVLLDDELLEYYSYLSNKGDVHSQVSLAQLLLQRGFDDDVSKAAQLFQEVVSLLSHRDKKK